MSSLYTLAFPHWSEPDRAFVEQLRREHEPRFSDRVAAHFTLAFGCTGVPEADYRAHVRQVAQAAPPLAFCFRWAMLGADALDETAYAYLVPDEGFSALSRLHAALYRGPLAPFLRLDIPFVPHITVCSTPLPAEAKALCDALNRRGLQVAGEVRELSVCRLVEGRIERLEALPLAGVAG